MIVVMLLMLVGWPLFFWATFQWVEHSFRADRNERLVTYYQAQLATAKEAGEMLYSDWRKVKCELAAKNAQLAQIKSLIQDLPESTDGQQEE